MRFCDFFLDYKIQRTNIKALIPWTALPRYRKIAIIITFITLPSALIFGILRFYIAMLINFLIFFILVISFAILDSRPKNAQLMLDEHYSVYSKSQMDMLSSLLNKYNINANDNTSIDLLIAEAEIAKVNYDPFQSIKKPIKTLSAIIIPIIAYVAKKVTEPATEEDLLNITLSTIIILICAASIIIALGPIIRDLLYPDKQKYNYLIYDLRQLKIFKTQDSSQNS